MSTVDLDVLRYPIGRQSFQGPVVVTQEAVTRWLDDLSALPEQLRAATHGLNATQLRTSYRDGGWTVKQVVHHVADSHMNAYVRFKLALTEETPPIKPYDEALWAELADVQETPIDVSLQLIDALHYRMVRLLRGLPLADFERGVFHPEYKSVLTVGKLAEVYSWHGRHHTAQITSLRERSGWD